jgi:hypothetical protein
MTGPVQNSSPVSTVPSSSTTQKANSLNAGAVTSEKAGTTKSTESSKAMILYAQSKDQIIENLRPTIYKLVANFEAKKRNILQKNDTKVTDLDLRGFYHAVRDSLANDEERDTLVKIIAVYAKKELDKDFEDLSGEELIRAMNHSGAEFIREPKIPENQLYSTQNDLFFKGDLDPELKDKFIQHAANIFGAPSQWTQLPMGSLSSLQIQIIEAMQESVKELNDPRFSYIGNGSTGLTIKVEQGDFEAVLKLLIPEKDTEFGRDFQRELEAIKAYDQMQGDYPLVELPGLIYDKDGKPIAESGLFILKKLQRGESLFNLKDLSEATGEKASVDFYTNLGVSDEFLVQYLSFFTDFARAGIDLDDIRHYNYFYRPETQSLSLFEIGINSESEGARDQRKVSQDHPLAAAIHSLMSDITNFEAGRRQPKALKAKLEARAEADWGIKGFHEHRAAQVIRALQKAVKEERIPFSLEDLKAEVEFLKNDDDFFLLSPEGQKYLDVIEKHVNDPKFLEYTYG